MVGGGVGGGVGWCGGVGTVMGTATVNYGVFPPPFFFLLNLRVSFHLNRRRWYLMGWVGAGLGHGGVNHHTSHITHQSYPQNQNHPPSLKPDGETRRDKTR